MAAHPVYFTIGNEDFTDAEKLPTLSDAKNHIRVNYSENEKERLFGENHNPMIEKNRWNNDTQCYDVESYTPFIFNFGILRFFKSTRSFNNAIDSLIKYQKGL